MAKYPSEMEQLLPEIEALTKKLQKVDQSIWPTGCHADQPVKDPDWIGEGYPTLFKVECTLARLQEVANDICEVVVEAKLEEHPEESRDGWKGAVEDATGGNDESK